MSGDAKSTTLLLAELVRDLAEAKASAAEMRAALTDERFYVAQARLRVVEAVGALVASAKASLDQSSAAATPEERLRCLDEVQIILETAAIYRKGLESAETSASRPAKEST